MIKKLHADQRTNFKLNNYQQFKELIADRIIIFIPKI